MYDIYNVLIVLDEYENIDNEPVNVYTRRNMNTKTIPKIPRTHRNKPSSPNVDHEISEDTNIT